MRKALVVGIDKYDNLAALAGCVNDANQMHEILCKNEDGSPNFGCKLLTAPDESIDRAVLLEQLQELFAYKTDIALFYFAGHGTVTNLGGYLVTPDSERFNEGVSMTEVLNLANKSAAYEVVIILDCCHSGEFGILPAIQNDHAVLREGVSVLCASRGSQTAKEKDGHGVFTTLICAALNGGAADVIGNVTVAGVYSFVDQALGAWDQRPLFKSHVARLIPLRHCKPDLEIEILRLLPKYFPEPDYAFQLNRTFEPEEPSHDENNVKIFKHLQKCRAARLVVPVDAEHMYFAAIYSKSCKLTALGQFYWRLAKEGKL